jgi:tripartite-type tricarboxylate transporter receptor subunit TctC
MVFRRMLVLTVWFATLLSPAAFAYPDKPVRLIVPYAPGGAPDIYARLIAAQLSARLKATFIVENRTGGGGNPGASFVARSSPDGYTLLIAASPMVINMSLYKQPSFNTERDFSPVLLMATTPIVLAVRPGLGASNVKELVALAKAQDESQPLKYMSSAIGSAPHLAIELLKFKTGIKLRHVPYSGSAAAILGLAGGYVDVGADSLAVIVPLILENKIQGLAITGSNRSALLPSVPTMAEAGYPEVEALTFTGILAPRGTPLEIRELLYKEIVSILNDPTVNVRARIEALGGTISPLGLDDFSKFLSTEIKKWGEAVSAAGLTGSIE